MIKYPPTSPILKYFTKIPVVISEKKIKDVYVWLKSFVEKLRHGYFKQTN